MVTYEQVDNYMQELGLRYYKGSNEFITNLALKTDKKYAGEVAELLNSRAQGLNSNNQIFYELKNRSLTGSLCISAAFDSGLFRHLGNMIIDEKEMFSGKILDIGCDCGIVTCFIARQYPDCTVVGVDCNESAVNNARELAEKRISAQHSEEFFAQHSDFTVINDGRNTDEQIKRLFEEIM